MMDNVRVLSVLVVASVYFFGVDGCDNHKINLTVVRPMRDDNCIELIDPDVKLSKDCFAVITGCIILKKKLTTCQLNVFINKKKMPVPLTTEKDVCKEIENGKKDPDTKKKLDAAGMDPKCPFDPMPKMCAPEDTKINIEEYKSKFKPALGFFNGTIKVACDSCESIYYIEAEFKKGK